MPTLRELLNDGRTHVFDGAMGTMLYDRGVFLNVCYDELNLRQPALSTVSWRRCSSAMCSAATTSLATQGWCAR